MKKIDNDLRLKNNGFDFTINPQLKQTLEEDSNLLTEKEFKERKYKYNYLYKITNLINNKIYIGIHSTDNLDDGYMGSSKILKQSIRKRGLENFKKEILEFYPDRGSLREAEAQIVNEEFIAREDTYNLSIGGAGGESYEAYLKNLKRPVLMLVQVKYGLLMACL